MSHHKHQVILAQLKQLGAPTDLDPLRVWLKAANNYESIRALILSTPYSGPKTLREFLGFCNLRETHRVEDI